MKNPLTLAGIEPATFRFVAQHLNHCATAVQKKWVSGAFLGGKGGRCVRLTTLPCAVVMKSGNLNFLEPSGPLQACNGTALPSVLQQHPNETAWRPVCLYVQSFTAPTGRFVAVHFRVHVFFKLFTKCHLYEQSKKDMQDAWEWYEMWRKGGEFVRRTWKEQVNWKNQIILKRISKKWGVKLEIVDQFCDQFWVLVIASINSRIPKRVRNILTMWATCQSSLSV